MVNQDNHTVPSALSWAQAAREAARRGTMPLLEAKLSLKSSKQVTKSMEGQDKIQRSDSKSLGPEERHEKAQCHKLRQSVCASVVVQTQPVKWPLCVRGTISVLFCLCFYWSLIV